MAKTPPPSDELIIRLRAIEGALVEIGRPPKVANPAALGLFAFGLTTALLQGVFTGITEKETGHLVSPPHPPPPTRRRQRARAPCLEYGQGWSRGYG